MASPDPKRSNFRRFFLRGLGILLPTVLTIWILVAVFQFVDQKIAQPINAGVRELILLSPWPDVTLEERSEFERSITPEQRAQWRAAGFKQPWIEDQARRAELLRHWNSIAVGRFVISDLIGLLIAVILIYMAGAVLGSMIGRGIYQRIEMWFRRLPVVKTVYPHVKQVTDFLFGDEKNKFKFNRVVAVQYPRKSIWSIGLVTGETMQVIQNTAGQECYTLFIPSSPTPFTGYVITVPVADCVELPITIDDALRFVVTGGVIVPDSQVIRREVEAGAGAAIVASPPPPGDLPPPGVSTDREMR